MNFKFLPFCLSAFLLFCFQPLSAQTDTISLRVELSQIKEDVDKNLIQIKKLQKLKISGYIQGQFEVGQEFTTTKVGKSTSYHKDRDGKSGDFFRFGIRRGRIKISYEENWYNATFQLDLTEKGIIIKDLYFKVAESRFKVASLTVGIFNRPFGDEISYSSSRRESPERTVLFQKLFPDERDLGAMITLASPKGSKPDGLKLEAGTFCGNGITLPDNGKMDFIGQLKYNKKWKNYTFGIGASMYYGTVRNTDSVIYEVKRVASQEKKWVGENVPNFQKNIRQYYGLDANFSVQTSWGITNLRSEVLFGTQPSTENDFSSPKSGFMQFGDTPFNYLRKFWGLHTYFVQDIYKTPLTFVLKYAFLNPNTQLNGSNITNMVDLPYHYFGAGFLVKFTSYLHLLCFYELPFNSTKNAIPVPEKPSSGKIHVANYQRHVEEGVFTCRMQFKF